MWKYLKIKAFSKEIKLSPVFIETTASIIAGILMLLWGFTFFSNATFQFSVFTKLRNLFVSEKVEEEMLQNIYGINIDYDAVITAEQTGDNYFDLIAESIKNINNYAVIHDDKRIVVGIDIILHDPKDVNMNMNNLISVLSNINDNLYIVFGGALHQKPERTMFLRYDFLMKRIIEPAALEYQGRDSLYDHILIGNVNYIKSSVKSGLDRSETTKIALGYYPVYKDFYSVPFIMYLLGEVFIEKKYHDSFYNDPRSGTIICDDLYRKLFNKKFGKKIEYFGRELRYNFFTGKDITDLSNNVISLSEVSSKYSPNLYDTPIDFIFLSRAKLKDISTKENNNTDYFFLFYENPPDYMSHFNLQKDEIITPASYKNSFTYEYIQINGAMVHMVALSNLKNSFTIINTDLWFNILIMILVMIIIFFICWKNELIQSVIFTCTVSVLLIVFSFILFSLGIFYPIRFAFAALSTTFGLTILIRFFYSSRNIDMYQSVLGKIFSQSQINKIRQLKKDLSKPYIIRDGIIMILLLKDLPKIKKTEESAEIYSKIYEKFLSLVFNQIEKYEGSHDILYMDGVIGFWDVITKSENSIINAHKCAEKCIDLIPKLQKFIDNLKMKNKIKYKVNFDICLHKCDFFAGCVGEGKIKNYALSSRGIKFAIAVAREQTKDKKNSLIMTKEFKKDL